MCDVSTDYIENDIKVMREQARGECTIARKIGGSCLKDHREDEETVIMFLKDALSMSGGDATYFELPRNECEHFPAPGLVAEKFTLNLLQRKAFILVAEEMLHRMADGYNFSGSRRAIRNFSTMYLGGEGGTGKTRVIEALQYLAKAWCRPRAIRTCAPTGIAASLVRGQTVHSMLGLRPGSTFDTKEK